MPEYLTVSEVLAILGRYRVTRRMVYAWLEAGKLKGYKPGDRDYRVEYGSVVRLRDEWEEDMEDPG